MSGEGFGQVDLRQSLQMLQVAITGGITHFDSANIYAHGGAERLLGKAVKHHRKKLFISSKGGLEWQGQQMHHNASARALTQSLEESLKRLNTDYLDLYQLHWPDPNTPLKKSVKALKQLQQQGKIRYWGVGNLTSSEVNLLPKGDEIPHQVHFNPIAQNLEILKAGREDQRCFNCITSPLEQGLLSTSPTHQGLKALGKRDLRRRNPLFHCPEVIQWAAKFQLLCHQQQLSPEEVTLQWIWSQPEVDAIICGPKRESQLQQLLTIGELAKKHLMADRVIYRQKLEQKWGRSLSNHLRNRINC